MGTLEREEKSNNYDVNNYTFYIKCRFFFHELYEIYKVNTHAVSKASLIQIMRLNAAFLYEIIPNTGISKCILFCRHRLYDSDQRQDKCQKYR